MAEQHDELISEFVNITGADAERSKFYLESTAWNLELALQTFYDEPEVPIDERSSLDVLNQAIREDIQPPDLSNLLRTAREDSEDEDMDNSGAAGGSGGARKKQPAKSGGFATLGSLRNQQEESDSDDEGQQAFYAGGSEVDAFGR